MSGILGMSKRRTATGIEIEVSIRGNVGDEGRAKLDALGMSPKEDFTNYRYKIVKTPEELEALRRALIDAGLTQVAPGTPTK
jgi:hypothetical protein